MPPPMIATEFIAQAHSSSQRAQKALWVNRPNREQIRFVERQEQRSLVNIEEMLVGSHQQWDLCQRGLSQDQAIAKLIFRNKSAVDQLLRKPLGNCLGS